MLNSSYSRPFLGTIVNICVDRPLGSTHPKHGWIYPVNYGYIPNIFAPDGEELDVYILGVSDVLNTFSGRCIAIIHRLNDDDDKLIIVPEGTNLSDEQIRKDTYFQEQFFKSEIIR